ncbi:MAG TPA: ABC transporter permease [Pyrinomonadaceae bacterium]|nr:ABC transporter permease [Pyrinomonadaceae bacterium]
MTKNNSASALESIGPTAVGNQHAVPYNLPHHLPDEPLVIIEPSQSWPRLDFREVWTYRELLYFLVWRDIKVRYKQTALGVVWVVMQPLLTTLLFTLILGRLVGIASDGIPYALFVYAGMLPWTFFASAVTSSSNSLVGNSHLITKVYFPRVLIPVAAIAARLLDLAVAFAVLIVLMVYYRVAMGPGILMLPVYVALVMLFALALGMLSSALNVKYRDVAVMIPFLFQLWMFASPVVYPSSLVPGKWRWLYELNPMAGIIEGFRSALFGRGFDWPGLATSTIIILVMLVGASFLFRRMQSSFADIV